ncbi:MAG: hypothetical protein JJU05_13420 [Verrucomicrobia bacterium]|nr:hypothetical protein [Verrucomicrobiota bacterium]MCH8527436.1 hypothetical protein [Kiritimatiellia bacterium]
MRVFRFWFLACGLIPLMLPGADYVQLRDGRRIEGRIVEERPDAIHIETQRNESGTIRQVLIISASEISTWSSSTPRSRGEDSAGEEETAETFTAQSGTAYVERLLREAETMVLQKDFDMALDRFQRAADSAGEGLEHLSLDQRADSLELRAHALRLLGAALDGKMDHLDMLAGGREELLRAEQRRLRREWDELQTEIQRERQRRELGSRSSVAGLEEREKELRQQIDLLNARETQAADFQRSLEEERVKTEAHRRLNRERVQQATRAATEARRQAQRRR